MKKIYDFKTQLAYGSRKEAEFERLFGDFLERTDGYISDFIIKGTSLSLDLKSDTYDPKKTKNYFMERYSYADKNGGAWQALDKRVDYYVYYFPKTGAIYVFRTKELVKELNKICKNLPLIDVYNVSHTTRGYKVPREALDHIAITMEEMLKESQS